MFKNTTQGILGHTFSSLTGVQQIEQRGLFYEAHREITHVSGTQMAGLT